MIIILPREGSSYSHFNKELRQVFLAVTKFQQKKFSISFFNNYSSKLKDVFCNTFDFIGLFTVNNLSKYRFKVVNFSCEFSTARIYDR